MEGTDGKGAPGGIHTPPESRLPTALLVVLLALAAFGAWSVGLAVTVARDRSDLESVVAALARLDEIRLALEAGEGTGPALRARLEGGPPFTEALLEGRGMEEAAGRAAAATEALGDPATDRAGAVQALGDLKVALRRRAAAISRDLGESWSHLNVLVAASLLLAGLAAVTMVALRRGRRRAERFAFDLGTALEKLDRSRREAEEANAAKTRFLANVSHELRTPIQGILGAAELLDTAPLEPAAREHLAIVRQSSEHLLELVNDLLDLARIEAGRLRFVRESVDPALLVEEVGSLVGGLPRTAGVTLTIRASPGLPRRVWADGGRLRQVLANLAGNAIKFTEKGGVEIAVGAEPPSEGRVVLRFSVRDTGIGIAAEDLARLFRPFEQVEASSNRRFGGTGLGLAISREIVERMGGRLEVESAPGKGSLFSFALPLEEAPLPAAGRDAATGSGTGAPRGARGRRILVVDDEGVNRTVISALLRRLGCEVQAVSSGEEALRVLEAGGVDLVLMDVQMPGLDGHETTRLLREREGEGPRLRVVAITASALPEDRDRALASGMDDYLAKPVRLQDLERIL